MLTNLPVYISSARKAVVQVLGLLTALLALGLLPSDYAAYVATGVGVLTTVLHYWVSNDDLPGETPAVEGLDPDPEEVPEAA